MSVAALIFEIVMVALMLVLIFYCVILNRRLSALRNQDAQIQELITQLDTSSNRAEMAVQNLKATGLTIDRNLRVANENRPDEFDDDASPERTDAEQAVLRAIRRSRAEI